MFIGARLTFTLDQPYTAQLLAQVPAFALSRDDAQGGILVFRYDGRVFTDPCDPSAGTQDVAATPEALMEWLKGHPDFTLTEPTATTLGGASGLMVEMTAHKAEPCADPAIAGRIYLFAVPGVGDIHYEDPGIDRIYALTVGDDLLIVDNGGFADAEAFIKSAQPVIDSIVFTPR